LYSSFDIQPDMHVITYCAVGERASLSWFVLKELLNYKAVMNYDRSMAQWSRIANAPISDGKAA
jgi:thiosulfate/3-mercaptopyruvate sulfurtransferase